MLMYTVFYVLALSYSLYVYVCRHYLTLCPCMYVGIILLSVLVCIGRAYATTQPTNVMMSMSLEEEQEEFKKKQKRVL